MSKTMLDSTASFLGVGWRFPPAFTAHGADVQMAAGVDDIQQSLQILFETAQGERLMREDYGCNLQAFLFEKIDQGLINNLTSLLSNAILYHEPRIRLDSLEINPDESMAGLLFINLIYTVRSTNSRYNLVYRFYLA